MPTSTSQLPNVVSEPLRATRMPPSSHPQPSFPMRVLLLSNARPSRAWKLALRIRQEVPGVQICGIVQRPFRELPLIQQRIAAGDLDDADSSLRGWQRAKRWVQTACEELGHHILWCVHGCPSGPKNRGSFTVARLAKQCSSHGWPLLEATSISQESALELIQRTTPDLIIILGQFPSVESPRVFPSRGLIRSLGADVLKEPGGPRTPVQIAIEHAAGSFEPGFIVASLTLPPQLDDGPSGFTLKADLIADDLLVQTVAAMRTGTAIQAAEQVRQWMRELLLPYLEQLPASIPVPSRAELRAFCRSWFLLWMETVLLMTPFVIVRNWFRRWRGRYPVLILSYHVVSDRGHRMGISTQRFWRQVRFLQRHYQIVGLSEAVRLLRSGEIKVPIVSLTFDDGYADNFVSLRAVADEAGIPVSVFITTQPVALHTEFQHDVAKGERGAFPLSWSQARYWSRRGAEFGGHTRTHANCGTNEITVLQDEIRGAKADLERELGTSVSFFAFPYGKAATMSEEAMRIAQSAYGHFLSSFGGENLPHGTGNSAHLFRKPAYTEPWELELDLQGVFDLVNAVKCRLWQRSLRSADMADRRRTPVAAVLREDPAEQKQTLDVECGVPIGEPTATSE
jgi:peptidoglycan/xylan/chitin deacetylase (PgdA/CDA1 family)